ncbi:oxidoreductase HTATIP2-like [Lepeophtheirus salmonis]|uniref:oxidoreductase HTATIP2-like n=1 Tax=Lepeophtheirus salmonis TaxID=72036 RepID=UPI001AE5C6C0|nr:oxidoreductase HTATIP2-like [Lepeophtheirus salmonis]
MMKSCLLIGASGETGKEVLKCLLQEKTVSKVILISRRLLDICDNIENKDVEQRVVDFDNLSGSNFSGSDAAICCLGTTRGKSGAEGFYKVDHDYVLKSAELLKEQGCPEFHLLSSTGANEDSSFLFNKTKGEIERDVKALGFERTSIYRPSVLICERQESRAFEFLAQSFLKFFDSKSLKYSIPTTLLASVMVKNILEEQKEGFELLTQNDIIERSKDMK